MQELKSKIWDSIMDSQIDLSLSDEEIVELLSNVIKDMER